jgi:hypothetical protein
MERQADVSLLFEASPKIKNNNLPFRSTKSGDSKSCRHKLVPNTPQPTTATSALVIMEEDDAKANEGLEQ